MSALPEFPAASDPDAQETQEWLDALEAVLEREGPERAHYLLEKLVDKARRTGAYIPFSLNTAYLNTIPPHLEERSPGDHALEERIRSFCRWNAMVMVAKANKSDDELGGHIASFASVGTLFGIGFNHFWNAPHEGHGGDLVYFQGHSSPGIYARAFLEGRLSEEQVLNFRREVDGKGISSYPHPWLMPDFWQFPTVSMGLGPIQGIYMARFLKYLHARGLADTGNRKVWVFSDDGAFVRKHFFGKDPKVLEMVSRMTDEDIWRLNRGGHDPHKIYAAYAAAVKHQEQPTVILAKTIKGYGLGKQGQAKNPTHQLKKLDIATIREIRDHFKVPIPDDKLEDLSLYKPKDDDPVMMYLHERRKALGGYLPQRRRKTDSVPAVPPLAAFEQQLKGSEGREISTTMAFVRILT